MRPRVLQVITDTDRRGAQVFALDLQIALADEFDVETVALAPGRRRDLDVKVLGSSRLGLTTLRALRHATRDAAVVVAHGSSTLPASAVATVATGVPFVYRQISDPVFWTPTAARRFRVRLALSRARHVVALWPGSARVLHERFGVPERRITVVPNGVPARISPSTATARSDARVTFALAPDRPTVVYLGALVPEKGVDVAIRALAHVPDAQLLVAGDGPERDALEHLAHACAPARVTFTGSVDDPQHVYDAADVVVLPSRGGDSMPAVLIEAGLARLPAVSTPIDAIPEVVVDGETGVLVPPGDATALGQALCEVLADPARARALCDAAFARCSAHFTMPVVAEQWAAVLRAMVAEAPR
jgi:glycosyltransferase involved in cell wall biosynthesis